MYDDAGNVKDIRRNSTDTAGDERECFYHDSAQRLTRGITFAAYDTACPATASGMTATGPAPYHATYSHDARNNLLSTGSRTRTLAMTTNGLTCAAGTETTKPDTLNTITASNGSTVESFRSDCNGATMARYTPTTATAYAWDPLGRLEAAATGTRVTWTNQTGTSVNATYGDLTATNTLNDTTWAAGATSTQTLTGNGAVSFRFTQTPAPRTVIGLNNTNTGTNYTEIDYAIYQIDEKIRIFENGTARCPAGCDFFTRVSDTDIFTIQRDGTTVNYLRNGRIFYTSTVAASGTYIVDTAFIRPSTSIRDVTLTTGTTTGVERNVYDTAGQRVLRVDPNTTRTIYLGTTELRWSPGNTTTQVARYYPGGTQRGFDGTIRYAVPGHQNSINALVTTTGTVTFNQYQPYGAPRTNNLINDKGFLNQTHDPDTGLVYLNNRYHDPTLGVFLSVDPLVTATGEPYIYAGGNPTTLSDPTGLCWRTTPTGTNYDDGKPCGSAQPSGASKTNGWPANLPAGGSHSFEPRRGDHGKPTKGSRSRPGNKGSIRGWIDTGDNIWQWDPVKEEWDVQHPDGSHTNVGADGEITHGDDNFLVGLNATEWFAALDEARRLNMGQYTELHGVTPLANVDGEVYFSQAQLAQMYQGAADSGLDLRISLPECGHGCQSALAGTGIGLGTVIVACVFFCIPTPWPIL